MPLQSQPVVAMGTVQLRPFRLSTEYLRGMVMDGVTIWIGQAPSASKQCRQRLEKPHGFFHIVIVADRFQLFGIRVQMQLRHIWMFLIDFDKLLPNPQRTMPSH